MGTEDAGTGQEFNVDQELTGDPTEDNSVIRNLRAEAKRAKEQEKEIAALKAENSAAKRREQLGGLMGSVGIKTEDQERFAKLADKFIDGDLEEAKVRDLASEYSFLTAQNEQQSEAQRMAALSGARAGGVTPGAPATEGAQRMNDVRDRLLGGKTVTQAEAMAALEAGGYEIDTHAATGRVVPMEGAEFVTAGVPGGKK